MLQSLLLRCVNGDQLRVFQYYLQNESEDPNIEGVMIEERLSVGLILRIDYKTSPKS